MIVQINNMHIEKTRTLQIKKRNKQSASEWDLSTSQSDKWHHPQQSPPLSFTSFFHFEIGNEWLWGAKRVWSTGALPLKQEVSDKYHILHSTFLYIHSNKQMKKTMEKQVHKRFAKNQPVSSGCNLLAVPWNATTQKVWIPSTRWRVHQSAQNTFPPPSNPYI